MKHVYSLFLLISILRACEAPGTMMIKKKEKWKNLELVEILSRTSFNYFTAVSTPPLPAHFLLLLRS